MKASTLASVSALLTGMAILLAGSGLVGTLLGLRAHLEGFSDFAVGVVMSAFFLGYVAGAFVCPPLIRRVGHIRAFAAMASLSAAVSLLYGLAVDPVAWWLLRLVNGIALVGLYMVVESWLGAQVEEGRGQVFAVYMMASLLALAAGQGLVLVYGPEELASFALVAVLFSLGLIPIAMTRAVAPAPVQTPHLSLGRLYRTAPTGVLGAGFSGMVTGAFWGLAAVYAAGRGLDAGGVAAFIAATILGGALLQWPIGRLSDHRDRRRVLLVVALLAALAALAMLSLGDAAPRALPLAGAVYGGLSFSLYGLSVAQTHDRLQRAEALQATQGLLLVNGIGATLGPLLAGAAMQRLGDDGFPLSMVLLLLLLAGFLAYRIRVGAAVPESEQVDFVPVTRTSPVAMELDPRLAPGSDDRQMDEH